jgi:hypothetical protein
MPVDFRYEVMRKPSDSTVKYSMARAKAAARVGCE